MNKLSHNTRNKKEVSTDLHGKHRNFMEEKEVEKGGESAIILRKRTASYCGPDLPFLNPASPGKERPIKQ
jgi:hypothetical protein